ncbi:MAG: GntR family transcriptional regulator [Myxococcaceae bacterium]|nr:GntR family transcriptional regulator [Myxococcaceae bacterium]
MELLYETLAAELSESIARGVLRPGDRLPSVRLLARQRKVSVATVLQAYLRLENEGLIEVRPQSGHYVRPRRALELAEPRTSRRAHTPAKVQVSTGVAALVASMRDPSVVPLGSALLSPDLLPTGALNRMLAGIAREMSSAGATYESGPGLLTLRRQLARRSVTWGMSLGADDFVTTNGAVEALHLALRAVARPGDAIAVESPTYFGVLQLIEELGLKAVEVPTHPRTGVDLEELEQVIRTTASLKAVLVMPTVSNPLGTVMSDEAKQQLVRLVAKYDLDLIEDDAYGELVFDSPRPRPARAWDREGRVLFCGSISKTLAPGYRVGWIAPGRHQERIEQLKFAFTVASPTLPQMAVAEFLASGGYDRHLRRLRATLRGQVDRVREAIADSFPAGTRVTAPAGGFVLWVELPQGADALELQSRALARGIAIAPGQIFSARGRFAHCLRLSCGFPWSARIEAAITTVGELATVQLSRRRTA